MSKLKVLYVASEIQPFLSGTQVAEYICKLPQYMQDRGFEIRILVPRFGLINERKNRLHEVVRLSGINIAVGDDEKPLTIKVASIPNARIQVYFIDNEDYFHRKSVFVDKKSAFFEDNDERAIFFCKGVLETVKKLGWAPDIVHCNDWFTSLIPLYLKTTYRNDPMFKDTKTVFTIYDTAFQHQFNPEQLIEKVKQLDVEDEMLTSLAGGDYSGFIRIGAEYADMVTKAGEVVKEKLNGTLKELDQDKIQVIEFSDSYEDAYYELYNELVTVTALND